MSWGKAVDAAWQALGVRYWRVIVGMHLLGKVLPALAVVVVLAAAAGGVMWLVDHLPALHAGPAESRTGPQPRDEPAVTVPVVPEWVWWATGGVAVLALVVALRRLLNPYRADLSYGAGRWVRRVGTVATAAAVVLLAWAWKG